MSRYSVACYRPELVDQVLRVETRFWNTSLGRAAAFFDWKYARNPYTAGPLVYVALCEGRVVGVRGMFGTCWEIGDRDSGERFLLPAASDFIIDQEHRDSGLYREFNEYLVDDLRERGYTHALNLSPVPANYVALVLTMGWRLIGSAGLVAKRPMVRRPLAGLRSAATRLPGLKKAVRAGRRILANLEIDPLSKLCRRARREGADHAGFPIVVEPRPRPEAMAELARRLARQANRRFRHVQDREYFEWRFENPLASYRFLYWEKSGGSREIDGYLVVRHSRSDVDVNLVDWQGEDPGIRSRLLSAAMSWGRFRNVTTWSGTLPEGDVVALRQAGFMEATDGGRKERRPARAGRILVRSVARSSRRNTGGNDSDEAWSLGGLALNEIGNWDLRMIWSDQY